MASYIPVVRAAAGLLAAAVAGSSLVSPATCVHADEVFENCDAIGDGLKAEFWKRFHSNVEILSMEDESVQLMITHLRSRETSPETFKHYADRLASILVEKTISTLPNDEVVVTTPHGKQYKGLALEEDHPLLGVLITRDGRLLEPALRSALPGLQVASVWTSRGADGNKQVDKHDLPADIAQRRVLLLEPVSGRGQTLKRALDFLVAQGVSTDRIHVLGITMSPEVADMLQAFKGVQVVTATIETGRDDETGFLTPGMGQFDTRYSNAR